MVHLALFESVRELGGMPDGAMRAENAVLRAKDFAWGWRDIEAYRPLYAYIAKALPPWGARLDADTPIASRPTDDLIKTLAAFYCRRCAEHGIQIDLALPPVRYPDFYVQLSWWRECEPPAPRGGNRYDDGFSDACMIAVSLQLDAEYIGQSELTDEEAARKVIAQVGWCAPVQPSVPGETRVYAASENAAIKRVALRLREDRKHFDALPALRVQK